MLSRIKISESDLIKGLNNDSPECFTELYNLWVSRVYEFVYQFTKSEKITDDIVQETFISVWNYRKTLKIHKSIKSYIYSIAYHLLVKELKRQIKNPLMAEYINFTNEPSVSENTVTQDLDFDQFTRDYLKAKTLLTPRQLQIFELNKENDCSIREISEQLSISEQSVKNQLVSACKIIRSNLQKYHYFLWILFGI